MERKDPTRRITARIRKTDAAACARAIHVCLRTARTLTTMIAPFLPGTADQCAKMLGLDDTYRSWSSACEDLRSGLPLGEAVILVRKLDAKELFPE